MKDLFKELFIFEIANNHQGNLAHGKRIISEMGKIAHKLGINAAIKFQYRDLDTLVHPEFINSKNVKHIPRFLETRLMPDEFAVLVDAARKDGMRIIVTPFDEKSVKLAVGQNVDILKVASCSAVDWPLLYSIIATKKPIIISTGGLSLIEIDDIVNLFLQKKAKFGIMHCVALYPAPAEALNLGFISRLNRRYPSVMIGYSGHEAPDDFDVVKVAVANGANMLERHVGVREHNYKLNAYSMNPVQAECWVRSAQKARTLLGGSREKPINQDEVDSLLSLKRGTYAAKSINKGERINKESVFYAIPCASDQITSGEYEKFGAGMVASKNYEKNAPITEVIRKSAQDIVNRIIHNAKGLINEAGLQIGSKYEVELSHHYGKEHFSRIGALVINFVNREYCKKLVVLLPGQHHPNHHHRRKEETFQLLWGDLNIRLNGKPMKLKPGDLALIERQCWHSFSSVGGAIIEEISTTHYADDSYYEDKRITMAFLDKRKTSIGTW
jgi:sialic acid synthase SpsE/quercetin dioxygenase-like cupin family protein